MENMWQFKRVKVVSQTPKEILREQAELLPPLTGDMVYASVSEIQNRDIYEGIEVRDDFMFSFLIKSKFLSHYQFRVLTVSHGIPVYPVKVFLEDDSIRNELQQTDPYVQVNEAEFKELLRDILSSDRIGTVISSIIQLAK